MHHIIQIAGIKNLEEAQMLFDSGVDWLGFPFFLPVHEEDLTLQEAATIVQQTDAARCILITYLNDANEILSAARSLDIRNIQIHGEISREQLRVLRQAQLFLIKSLIVRQNNFEELAKTIEQLSEDVDAFITDTFDPSSGASGATGKTHDWTISRKIVEISPRPVILAGGLDSTNVEQAIQFVRPAGVDAHTGVENFQGVKDPVKVRAFVKAARKAF